MVTWYELIRFIIAITAYYSLRLWAGDFTGAYLNTRPQGLNFLWLPQGYKNWYKLRSSIQTALLMTKLGHKSISADPCVQLHHRASSTQIDEEEVIKGIQNKYEFRSYGKLDITLGITIWTSCDGNISIHQKPLIQKTLIRFGMLDCAPKHMPISDSIDFNNSQPSPISPKDHHFMLDKDYSVASTMSHKIPDLTSSLL